MQLVPEDKSLDGEILRSSVKRVLQDADILALACCNREKGEPHCSTLYFCYDDNLTLYFVSENWADHSKFIESCPHVMCAVYLLPQVWGENLHGVQLVGQCFRLSGPRAAKALFLYAKRFSTFKVAGAAMEAFLSHSGRASIFAVTPSRGKLLHEVTFGRRNYIEFQILE